MNKILRNILAVVAGLIAGSAVNWGVIKISGYIIPPPEGTDVTTMEGLKDAMLLFQPKHFIMPFLAHAFGTFAGALLVVAIAANNKMKLALGIGIFFLIGGIISVISLPSPTWFSILDLSCAYIPMAYIAGKMAQK